MFARLVAPSLWSRAVRVIHSLAWFANPTVTFLPSGVLPVMDVPGGIDRPPPGVSGVIHSRVTSQSIVPECCRLSVFVRPDVRLRVPLLSPATGVCQQPPGLGVRIAFPVGEDEEPLAPMRRADFLRCEEACRKPVAQADQVSGDLGKAEAEMMGDVFEEDEGRPDLANDAGDVGPEVPRVGRPQPPAGDRERLARIARNDDVHAAAPPSTVEGGNVVPDRRVIQGRVLHPGHEQGRGEGFPLDVTHSPVVGTGEDEPEVEPADAGAEREPEQAVSPTVRQTACGM